MTYSWQPSPRRGVRLMLFALAAAIAACSGNDTSTLPTQAALQAKPDSNIMWNFTPVVFGSGSLNSMVSGINDESRIVGVSGNPNTAYNSYTGKCTTTSGTNVFFVCASQPIQQRGTATHTRYGCPERASTHAVTCACWPRAGARP